MSARKCIILASRLSILLPFVVSVSALNAFAADVLEIKLQPVRWQELPQVRNVVFDRQGKAWFELDGRSTLAEFKQRIELAGDEESPRVLGGYIVHFDRKQRIWLKRLEDQKLLLCYSPATKTWQEHRLEDGVARRDMGRKISVWESANGYLYFGTSKGVHVLKDDAWSYQPLFDANFRENKFHSDIKGFNMPEFAEDADGRVLVWSIWESFGWTGTLGFFVHYQDEWRQIRGGVGDQSLERIASLTPLGDAVFVCPAKGNAFFISPPERTEVDADAVATNSDIKLLGDQQFTVREEAEKRLRKRGSIIAPALEQAKRDTNDPEVSQRLTRLLANRSLDGWTPGSGRIDGHTFSFARSRLVDQEGALWFSADTITLPSGEVRRSGFWRVSPQQKVLPLPKWAQSGERVLEFVDSRRRLYAGGFELGCLLIENNQVKPVTDDTQKNYDRVIGEDREGRVYLTGYGDGHFAAFNDQSPDPRRTLVSTAFMLLESSPTTCLDSAGRVWAKLKEPEDALISVFENGAWRNFTLPTGARIRTVDVLQPLENGRLVLAGFGDPYHAYYFDGEKWQPHKDLKHLVEAEFNQLRDIVDNRHASTLGRDAQKRVWLTERYKTSAFDGRNWIDVTSEIEKLQDHFSCVRCVPIDGGQAMLISDTAQAIFRVSIAGSQVSCSKFEISDNAAIQGQVLQLSEGKDVLLQARGRFLNEDLCYQVRSDHVETLKDTGSPRHVDSAGDVWFVQPSKHKLVVLSPGKLRSELHNEELYFGLVVEQSPQDFWVTTGRGLAHVRKQSAAEGRLLQVVAEYTKDVPRSIHAMYFDKAGFLWLRDRELRETKLWRLRLPNPQ